MSESLTEFLLARIAEDEAVANAAATDGYGAIDWAGESGPTDVHIARHDPARVLAECEAKRQIVELHQDFGAFGDCYHEYMGADSPCPTLRALALPYADHPGYDESWRP